MDNRIGSIIDMRGSPYQTCWQCGELAGGNAGHYYYGNFPFGIQHGHCGERIQKILNRSLRALSALDDESIDQKTRETTLQTLITVSASKFQNCTLDKIKDDLTVRKIVESDGMSAALRTFRMLSRMDDNTWQNRLEKNRQIMQGPELIDTDLTEKDKETLREIWELIEASEKRERDERIQALKQVTSHLKSFIQDCKNNQNIAPYCIIGNLITPYYDSDELTTLLKQINDKSPWRVLFLAEEILDGSYKKITHINVEHIALIESRISLDEAHKAWQKEHNPEAGKTNVFTLDCLEWQNYWVYIKEIGWRISLGEGLKNRPNP